MNLECQNCGAEISVGTEHRTAICPYCASPSVVDRVPSPDRPSPSFALAFTVTKEAAASAMRTWARSQALRFRQSGLHLAPIEKIQGIYVPAYLFSAIANTTYSVQIGENYTDTETYTTTDAKGNSVTRTRTVIRTEWRSLKGNHSTYMADVLVTASRGLSNDELEAIEPFDLRAMRRYGAEIISGWLAEEPSMSTAECLELAREESLRKIDEALANFMPGDDYRNLHHETYVEQEVLDLVLVPVWTLAVRFNPSKPPMRVILNGQTARVWGRAPLSWIKILVALGLVLIVLALVSWWLLWGGA